MKCGSNRTISLIVHGSKVILKIISNRLKNKLEQEVSIHQAGFQKYRGTRDQLFNLKQIIEKQRECNLDLYICFIDAEIISKVRYLFITQVSNPDKIPTKQSHGGSCKDENWPESFFINQSIDRSVNQSVLEGTYTSRTAISPFSVVLLTKELKLKFCRFRISSHSEQNSSHNATSYKKLEKHSTLRNCSSGESPDRHCKTISYD